MISRCGSTSIPCPSPPAKSRAPLGTGLFEWPDDMVERFADRQMDTLAARANHETGSDYDLEVLRALLITERDVMKLVDMGYLTQEQQGKRFVFTPTSRLQELFPAPSLARLRGFAVDLLTPEFPPGSFSA